MDEWVTAPVPLSERTLDVEEGTVAVILRNGQVYDVRGPGRHGGLWRTLTDGRGLPITGSLKVMTFHRAPDVSDPVSTRVRLVDGATVDVTVKASIIPRWKKNPATAGEVVHEYGTNPRRIEQAEREKVISVLTSMITAALSGKTHDQVHANPDYRDLLQVPQMTGLLQIGEILSCQISRDVHAEAAVNASRQHPVDILDGQNHGQLEVLRAEYENKVDAIRLSGQLWGQQQERLTQTEIDGAIAKMLGVPVTDVAFTGSRDVRERAKYEAVLAVLRDNLDIIPLLADPAAAGATEQLHALVDGLFSAPETSTANAGAALPAPVMDSGGAAMAQLLRKAVMASPVGAMEVLLVGSGQDSVLGRLGSSGPHRLLVVDEQDPVAVAMRALSLAATWCGVRVRAAPSRRGLCMTGIEAGAVSVHPDVLTSLGIWIAGINIVLDGRTMVSVQD